MSHYDYLNSLSSMCIFVDHAAKNGWDVDEWEVSPAALDAVVTTYRQILLIGELSEEIQKVLEADGIDLDSLLRDDASAVEKLTRADLTEIAAAASMIAREGAAVETMLMPNVPKGERSTSCPGIDIMAVCLRSRENVPDLLDGEMFYICSVKHTISDPSDLRYKLVDSLAQQNLNRAYFASQLRLLHGRLADQGLRCDRLLLAVTSEGAQRHVKLIAVGALDIRQREAFIRQMNNLPEVPPGKRRFRHLLINDIAALHTLVQP